MRYIIAAFLLMGAFVANGQSVVPLRGDTIKIYKVGGYAELVVQNRTKDSLGVMINTGNGKTEFRRAKKLDSTHIIIGLDTLEVGSGSSSSADSSIFATLYRLDTAKINLRATDALKKDKSDSTGPTSYVPRNQIDTAKDNLRNATALKKNNSDSTGPTSYVPRNQVDTMRAVIYGTLSGKMNNYGNAPGQIQGTYAAIPAATSYPTGTTYIAQDSGFHYVDTGSGGSRGWKRIAGGSGGGGSGSGVTKAQYPLVVNAAGDSMLVDTILKRKGTILYPSGSEQDFAEVNVIYETGPQVLTGVPGGQKIFKATYTSGWQPPQIDYAESLTGLPGSWVRYSGNPVIPNHCRTWWMKDGSNYYIYADSGVTGQIVNRFVSTDGIHYTKDHANMLTPGLSTEWNHSFGNPSILKDGSTWYMLIDGLGFNAGVDNGYTLGLYTGTDGFTWTPYAGNPVLRTLSAPWVTKRRNKFVVFGHHTMSKDFFPNDIFCFISSDSMKTWQNTHADTLWNAPFSAVLHRETWDEGVDSIYGGVGDVFLTPVDSSMYIFYAAAMDAQNSTGHSHFKLAIANMSLDSLLKTRQNASPNMQWESYGRKMYYTGGPAGVGTAAPQYAWDVRENGNYGATGLPGTVHAQNFMSTMNNLAIFGVNMQYRNAVYRTVDTTNPGMAWVAHNNGLQISGLSIGSTPTLSVYGQFLPTGDAYWLGKWGVNTSNLTSAEKLQVVGDVKIQGNFTSSGLYNGVQVNYGGGSLSSNIAIGGANNALQANTTGTANTAMGPNALNLNSTGQGNTAIGNNALNKVTASFNTGVGQLAMQNQTSGQYNTGVGRAVWNALTTGSGNTGIGVVAGANIVAGNANTALGDSSLFTDGTIATTDGSRRMGIGFKSQVITDNTAAIGGVNFPYAIGMNLPDAKAQVEFSWNGGAANKVPVKFRIPNITTTAATGNGSQATISFAAQPYAPFRVGETIVVSGVTPSGYNGAFTVIACSTTGVSYTNTTTGSQTVAGKILGSVLTSTPEPGAVEPDGLHLYFTDINGARLQLDNVAGGGGISRIAPIDSMAKDANGIQVSGISLVPQSADGSFPGLVTTGTQTFAGVKTMPAPKFTGLTGAGANDSVLTIDPATNQIRWRYGLFNLHFANGLTAVTNDSVYLGGPLVQNTTIDGGASNWNLKLGDGVGNRLGSLQAYTNNDIVLNSGGYVTVASGIKHNTLSSGDVSFTADNTMYFISLSTVTANRTATLPAVSPSSTGQVLIYIVRNTSGTFHWSFGSGVVDASGASITTLTNGSVYHLYCDGTNWVKFN